MSCLSSPDTMYFASGEAWAVLYPKDNCAKKKTNSEWIIVGAQYSLGNRLVLSGAIMSYVNRTLSYLNAVV